jgi:hypothetical protein
VGCPFFILTLPNQNINKIIMEELKNLDLSKDQPLMSIRKNGQQLLGYVEIQDGKIVTNGQLGYNEYENFVHLIWGLMGFGINIDEDIYF